MVRDFESLNSNIPSIDNLMMGTKVGTAHWSGSGEVSRTVTTSYQDLFPFSTFTGNGIIDGVFFNPGNITNNSITRHLRWRITIDDVVFSDIVLHNVFTLSGQLPTTYNINSFVPRFFTINSRFYRNFKIEVKRVGDVDRTCDFRYLYRTL